MAKRRSALLGQNGGSQMPDGMKPKWFHLGLGTKPFHHVGCRFIGLPDVRLNRAGEHMVFLCPGGVATARAW